MRIQKMKMIAMNQIKVSQMNLHPQKKVSKNLLQRKENLLRLDDIFHFLINNQYTFFII